MYLKARAFLRHSSDLGTLGGKYRPNMGEGGIIATQQSSHLKADKQTSIYVSQSVRIT